MPRARISSVYIYIINFIIVLVSIILFIAPFFFVYWLSHKDSFKKLSFSHYLELFFSSKQANWLVFFWAASEALFWFVIPEFLLLLVIFMRVHRKRQMLIADIVGTVVGTLVAMIIRLPESTIEKIPYVQQKMIEQAHIWYSQYDVLGLLYQPLSGVPYKVFTHLSWQYSFPIIAFLIVAVAARIFRYIVAYGLFIALYPRLHKIVYRNYVPLFIIATLIFSILLYRAYNIYS